MPRHDELRPRGLPRQLVFPAQEHPREESGGERQNRVLPKEARSACEQRVVGEVCSQSWRRRGYAPVSSAPIENERGEPDRTENGRDDKRRAGGAEHGRGGNPKSDEAAAESRRGAEKRAELEDCATRKGPGRLRLGGRGARLKQCKSDLYEVAWSRGSAHRRSTRAPT